jgi:hypothetical protein
MKTLGLFMKGTHSAPAVGEALAIDARTARSIVQQLTRDGFLEEHPDLPRRYRLAGGSYGFGLALVACALRELELREVEHRDLLAGRALFRYRRARGISQERFAAMLRLSLSDYGLIERGQQEVSGTEVIEFASRLNVDVLDLLMMRRRDAGGSTK